MYFKNLQKIFILTLIVLFFTQFNVLLKDNFPVPNGFKNMLFYVQRNINKNTILYELNYNENGELNESEPIKVNWINYETDKSLEALNYIQRTFAYGLNTKILDKQKKSYSFNFVSYKKKILYLIKSSIDKKYHVYYTINKKMFIVQKIHIQIEGGTFWVPKVKYLEIILNDPTNNEKKIEKIIP